MVFTDIGHIPPPHIAQHRQPQFNETVIFMDDKLHLFFNLRIPPRFHLVYDPRILLTCKLNLLQDITKVKKRHEGIKRFYRSLTSVLVTFIFISLISLLLLLSKVEWSGGRQDTQVPE